MIAAEIGYERAKTIEEALSLLSQDVDAKLLSGGHSLVPLMKLRLAQPSTLIDVSKIPELRTLDVESERITIGAGVRYFELLGDTRLEELMPVIAQATSVIADPQVRHRGTIGGAAVHADPTSDLAAVFLALEARFHIRSAAGRRIVPIEDWYLAPLTSALERDEMLVAVEFPRPIPRRQAYVKFSHPASGYALAGVAAIMDLTQHGLVQGAGIAVTGAATMPFRASTAEAWLQGRPLNAESVAMAAQVGADDGTYDADDGQYPAVYRKNLARVMLARALEKLAPQ